MENYEYIGDLGSGSYGFVWKCLQRSSGKTVAVKGFKLAHTDKKFLDQAIREVRMLRAACDHPNIVQLLEAFRSSSGRVYMVFEYVDRCLSSELHKRFTCGLPAAQTRLVLYQLLCAVAHLHSKKIVHRDIKPGNLLMTADGVTKLCDFGFARTTRGEPYEADRFSSYVVTRWYRSPEMLVSDLYGAASDIWSLGCTFAELATGRPLFPGTSSLDQLWRIMRCLGYLSPSQAERFAAAAAAAGLPEPPPPPPRGKALWQRLPELDARLLDVVQACLQMDPAKRPTAAQLLTLPYFQDVPKLFVGTPLEQAYSEQGSRQRTPSARLKPQLPVLQPEQARSGGGASAPMPAAAPAAVQGAVAVNVVSSEELIRTADAERNVAAAAASLSRRNPPRQPSVLLSAVAASLLGEQEGASSGSIPLLPLAQPAVLTGAPLDVDSGGGGRKAEAGGPTRPATEIRSAGLPQGPPLRMICPSSSEAGTLPCSRDGAGTGSAGGRGSVAVTGAVLDVDPSGRAATGSMVIRSPSPSVSPRPPNASRPITDGTSPRSLPSLQRQNSRRSGLASSVTASVVAAAVAEHGVKSVAAAAAATATVAMADGEAASAAAAPRAAVPNAVHHVVPCGGVKAGGISSKEEGGAEVSAIGPGKGTQPGAQVVLSGRLMVKGPFSDAQLAATVLSSAFSSRVRPASAAASAIASAAAPANSIAEPVPVGGDAPFASGSSGDAIRRGGGGGFGLMDGADDLLSDGDGQVSEDDELMEYFASKAVGSAAVRAGSRRMLAVADGGSARTMASGTVIGSTSSRRLPFDGPHAAVQAIHHGLYGGSRHATGHGVSAPMPTNRRTAVLAGEGGSNVPQLSPQLPAPSAATVQMKRATVGSYVNVPATAESAAATAAVAAAAAVPSPPSRPCTTTPGSGKRTAAAEAGAMSYRAPQRPATESQASRGGLPYLVQSQNPLPHLHHYGTTNGIALPSSTSMPMSATHHGRTSLPAAGYGPAGGGLQYTTSGNVVGGSQARSRALSRQSSVVLNQLMYDALPEIGTPSGAPDVPIITPPRRRVVMSGFTPCRTAAARAAAEGIPPAAAMAAVLGDALQSATTDISVAFSPIHVGRSVDLMSPDRESAAHVHPFDTCGSSASVGIPGGVSAPGARRYHRRQASLHSAEPGYPMTGTACCPQYPDARLSGNAGPAAAPGPYPYPVVTNSHVSPHATAASNTGMLMDSSAPSYYRTHRAPEAAAGGPAVTGAASLSGAGTAGPMPIPGGVAGRLPVAVNLSGAGAAAGSSCSSSTGTGAFTTPTVTSRSGHQHLHQLNAPPARSRLASGNMARDSDASGATTGAASYHLGTQSMELDGLDPPGTSPQVHGCPGGPSHASTPAPAAPPQQGLGPPMAGAGRARFGRWAAVLIDSLPEDREVVHGDWQGSIGHQAPGGSGRMPGNSPEQGDDAIQMLTVNSPEWVYAGPHGGPSQQVMATAAAAAAASSVAATTAALRSPRNSGSVPRPPPPPTLPRNGSGADLRAGGGDVAAAGAPAGGGGSGSFFPGQSSSRSRRSMSLAVSASATVGPDGRREGSSHSQSDVPSRPLDVAAAVATVEPAVTAGLGSAPGASGSGGAGGDGAAAAPTGQVPVRKQSGSGSKWPKAKALLGGRFISTLVRKFKEQSGSSSAEKYGRGAVAGGQQPW